MNWAIAIVVGLILGSIPFGLLLTRAAGLGDIRNIGSGNIGATNVLRTGRKGLAAGTLLLDGGKGTVAVLVVAYFVDPALGWLAGLCAVLGHCTSVWLRFRGGKGVATGLGVLLAACWPVGVAACAVWLLAAKVTKMSSASALTVFVLAPFGVWWMQGGDAAVFAALMSLQIVFGHRGNIARLLAGTEPKIGQK